jgi:hypothetical protein
MDVKLKLVFLSILLLFITGNSMFVYAIVVSLAWLFIRAAYGILPGE